jgi:hypothetical protein
LTAHNRRDYEGQKGKSINVNYWWNMGDTSTKSQYFINDWYLGQIFSLYISVIMVLYIYKYWFKMLKRWKIPPLIKARASSTNCTMGNLTCSRHATYLHTIYVKSREIHILSTIQILGSFYILLFNVINNIDLLLSLTFFKYFKLKAVIFLFKVFFYCIMHIRTLYATINLK